MHALVQQHCQPLEGQPAMAAEDMAAHLRQAPGWSLVDGFVEKRFDFENYCQTMAFVNAVAWVAHREDHHPELLVSYNACVVRFNTHAVGGISINDFICAAKVDALFT
jgi:4a-hydroxytetrahydrobiopterin dehydratase